MASSLTPYTTSDGSGTPLLVVDIGLNTPDVTQQQKIAVQVCAGLFNRDETQAGAVYTMYGGDDPGWLEDVEGIVDPDTVAIDDFLSLCLRGDAASNTPALAAGYIRYNETENKAVVPNIVTMAGVLDAVPLEDGDAHITGDDAELVFDAQTEFSGFSPLQGTEYVFDNYANRTSALSKMNPGYADQKHNPLRPELTGHSNPGLIDFIVKERLFNFYLNNGCIPFTSEYALQLRMATEGPWEAPIAVYGYDNTWPIAGDLFEAETDCNSAHNMGQIASDNVNNLGYFSRKPAVTTPQIQNPIPATTYNASKTYMAFVMGDGDNVGFLKGSRRAWLTERVEKCEAGEGCFPLLWSMSPHVLHLSPDWLDWYYNKSFTTQNDYFVLPPSGHLYAYPGMMNPEDQATFVTLTEQDCELLNTSGVVSWEWFYSWRSALKDFYPQYGANGIVRSIFPVNVPYMFPIPYFELWGEDKFFEIYDDSTVMFKPREWRGTAGGYNQMTVEDFAKEINGYKPGTVTHSYVTSDGGFKLQDLYDLVALLDEHVELVDQETLANMALASAASLL